MILSVDSLAPIEGCSTFTDFEGRKLVAVNNASIYLYDAYSQFLRLYPPTHLDVQQVTLLQEFTDLLERIGQRDIEDVKLVQCRGICVAVSNVLNQIQFYFTTAAYEGLANCSCSFDEEMNKLYQEIIRIVADIHSRNSGDSETGFISSLVCSVINALHTQDIKDMYEGIVERNLEVVMISGDI